MGLSGGWVEYSRMGLRVLVELVDIVLVDVVLVGVGNYLPLHVRAQGPKKKQKHDYYQHYHCSHCYYY